ncbi:hypothetical protein N8615_03620 [Verrucomicrobiales bacterium]|nr:hypothetical protein [Verrucomicrobiales bacterium]MDC0276527.1 hypothetical protein [Verrucomicrobiales bacterium]
MDYLKIALTLAGIAHFGILVASANAPKALNWKETLKPLPKLMRQMFWVYGWFIVLMIISFGTITLVHTETLATAGTPIARWVSGMIAIFWGVRLIVQFFIFDATPFLTNWFYKLGYHGLTVVFIFLTAVYTWAAFFPNR